MGAATRSEIIKKTNNNIILDAYNANPSSMILAIKYFEELKLDNKILVLGDMFELGKETIKFHQEIIDYCEMIDVKKVYLIGNIFSKTTFSKKFIACLDIKELIGKKDFRNISNSNFLVKGSRGIKLENIIDFIS